MLFVLVVLAHQRWRIIHVNITDHPTAAWTAQQIVDAFPDDTAPRWLLRDRDAIYGDVFRRRVAGLGIGEVISSPSSPWQNPYAERLIGSIRRECLDHVIVLGERHLQRVLTRYAIYYHRARTHLSLEKDAPTPRRVQTRRKDAWWRSPRSVDSTIGTSDAQLDSIPRFAVQSPFLRCERRVQAIRRPSRQPLSSTHQRPFVARKPTTIRLAQDSSTDPRRDG
jgi:Integrase core domain